ncbi:hypothetical protein K2173_013277 [Erythroxylum novogranatense]|uniref:F-box domain-containing protein n=1 Tax=Erythroxylum novogranatense TaxID=1862640 RepID=A0AAV8S9Y8_9ROSI|nr:hypothetical protein K2173_013277 [Erythroxylum novogranatense]
MVSSSSSLSLSLSLSPLWVWSFVGNWALFRWFKKCFYILVRFRVSRRVKFDNCVGQFLQMETSVDFLNYLDRDVSLKIFTRLEDPADLVRLSSVSRSWRHFVVANGLSKQLCLRMFPCLDRVVCVTEPNCGQNKSLEVGCSSKFMEWENLEREHRVYSFLARGFSSFPLTECVSDAISASSTDNYPLESIRNTLEPRDIVARRASYWSSKGQSNPAVPETLIYKLDSDICVITEIGVHPFRAYFQLGYPIYSAKAVRFRLGHAKVPVQDPVGERPDCCPDDNFVWTYTSPEFPMAQENRLQRFELPEPALCIGGILQVELLGRVQRQDIDGLFYICICHVRAVGRSFWPAFSAEIIEPSGKFVLKAQAYTHPGPSLPEEEPCRLQEASLPRLAGNLEQIVNMLRGQVVMVEEFRDGENDESDEDDEFEFAD